MENISSGSNENLLFPIDLSVFKDHIKLSFLSILDNLPKTPKTLVIDQSCIKKLDFFVDIPAIEEKGFKKGIIVLSRTALSTDSPNIVYVIPPTVTSLEDISFQIQNHRKENLERKYTVVFIPKINYDCNLFIERNYLKAELVLFNLSIDMIPFDKDILSLEAYDTNQNLFLKGDTNVLSTLSRAIIKFESAFGRIKYKYAKGDHATNLKKFLESEEDIVPFENDNEILAAMIFDRSVDFITPLCSQFTYEGKIDEIFGIHFNQIKVKPQMVMQEGSNDVGVDLSSKEKFYSKIRDWGFDAVRNFLPTKVEEQNQIMTDRTKLSDNPNETAQFLEKFKTAQEEYTPVTTHFNIAEHIKTIIDSPIYNEYLRYEQELIQGGDPPAKLWDFYENEMAKQADPLKLLRVMCLESLVYCGLKPKVYDQLKRDYLNINGHQEVFLLRNLEKLKILKKQDQKPYYDFLNENLHLINPSVNLIEPDDTAYVFGGYCPITIRLIEAAVKNGWESIKDVIKRLPGDFEFPVNEKEIVSPRSKPGFILIVFIGGITYAEVAAVRYLNRTLKDHKFIILTTHIINSKRFLESLKMKLGTSLTMKDYFSQIQQLSEK